MTSQHLEQLLNSITRVCIAVIGDFCLDAYWFLDPTAGEVSLESKLLTRAVARQDSSPVGGRQCPCRHHRCSSSGTQTAATFFDVATGATIQKLFQTGTASPEEIFSLADAAS
jgi:hypothetical protein